MGVKKHSAFNLLRCTIMKWGKGWRSDIMGCSTEVEARIDKDHARMGWCNSERFCCKLAWVIMGPNNQEVLNPEP